MADIPPFTPSPLRGSPWGTGTPLGCGDGRRPITPQINDWLTCKIDPYRDRMFRFKGICPNGNWLCQSVWNKNLFVSYPPDSWERKKAVRKETHDSAT